MKNWIVLVVSAVLMAGAGLSAGASDPAEEKAVMGTLATLFQAYPKKDNATLNRIYHDDLSYGHSNGMFWTKAEVIADANKRTWEYLKITSSTVRVSGPVAVVRAVMDIQNMGPGKPPATNIGVIYVLLKGPQGWQVIVRQAIKTHDSKYSSENEVH